jgi:glucose/arabinose dehydrogenase
MRTWVTVLLMALAGAGCASNVRAPTLEPLWVLDGLPNPESVIPAADGDVLYVSNVGGDAEARDGNGVISRVSMDGTLLQRDWVTGLDAPKGMALAGGRLFVSDLAALVEIDTRDGHVVARHAVPGAKFLNDVAAAPDGSVLVSDSANGRLYAWHDGRMGTWLAHPLLAAVNGLLPEPSRLVVVTMQGRLLAIDWQTHAVTVLAEGLGDGDGIATLGGGAYLVSEWPGRLFHVATDGTSTVLLDTRAQTTYLNDVLLLGDRLVVPNLEPGRLSAFRLLR